ncbi:MAG: DUF421 domain-containing protein [Burkholderiaceae bacterium]|nr:MAG: DUF421 domain-containing protein [Burkholderiaceae bacterium]
MFNLTVNWWELILRALLTYGFMIVLLRITGKRQVGQLAPFDLVLLLILSNAVQNSINGGDNSLIGGFISALALVAANYTLSFLTYRSKRIAALIEGRPQVLVHNGHLYTEVMRKEKLTQHELDAALRAAGVSCIDHVHFAILENNGQISVQGRPANGEVAA